ncbi:hypothetical protein JHK85_041012 [Glycine max]|nr:hypothetical protein JHK86_040428 [Glycine max]KAG4966037.1 hypothetical protein JHK85_041012 [Glycine max]
MLFSNPKFLVSSSFFTPNPPKTPQRCVFTALPIPSKNPNFRSQFWNLGLTFKLSTPQTPSMTARGTEGNVMGLLLRERIVFLGSSIDDFVANAIMSQLLLLDAQYPTKDIRLFINSTSGSLKLDEEEILSPE